MIMRKSRDRPDLEDLAAFLDNRLQDGERKEVIRRLARDEAYYQSFLESVRFLDANRETDSGSRPDAEGAHAGGSLKWALRVAAVLLLGVGLLLLVGRRDAEPPLDFRSPSGAYASASQLIGALADVRGPGKTVGEDSLRHGWSQIRGPGGLLEDDELAFHVGVRISELASALDASRTNDSLWLISRIDALLRQADWSLPVRGAHQELRERIEAGSNPAELSALAASAELLLGVHLNPAQFALGRWVGVGHIAALAGHSEYFEDARVLEVLQLLQDAALSSEDLQDLRAISTLVDRPGDLDIEPLQETLARIIDRR